jgi:hypothetical protein
MERLTNICTISSVVLVCLQVFTSAIKVLIATSSITEYDKLPYPHGNILNNVASIRYTKADDEQIFVKRSIVLNMISSM